MGKNKHVDLFKDMIPAVDLGIKDLWDASTEEGQKEIKGDLWNLNRYISSVKGNNREQQEHFVTMVNELYNKHWFTLQKHPKLLWYLLCLCSWDKQKTFFHEWIPLGKSTNNNKRVKLLEQAYPHLKNDELELLAEINTSADLKDLAREMGWEEKEIKNL
jgi:hypothetical protein